jgi:hypothetical protein
MDAALLLVAGNETCPQPQTSEHLAAVEIMKLKNILILQNKIDLVRIHPIFSPHSLPHSPVLLSPDQMLTKPKRTMMIPNLHVSLNSDESIRFS